MPIPTKHKILAKFRYAKWNRNWTEIVLLRVFHKATILEFCKTNQLSVYSLQNLLFVSYFQFRLDWSVSVDLARQ